MNMINEDLHQYALDSDTDEAEALLTALDCEEPDELEVTRLAEAFVERLVRDGVIDPTDRDALLEIPEEEEERETDASEEEEDALVDIDD